MNSIEQHARKTKVVWSFESHSLSHTTFAKLDPSKVDAIRLVYDPEDHTNFVKSLTELKSKTMQVPVMVDMAAKVRAVAANVKEAFDLEYKQTVTLAPEGKKGDILLKTKSWNELVKEKCIVFLGYGNVLLQVESLSADSANCTVVQGGTVYPEIEVHVPATRHQSAERVQSEVNKLIGECGKLIDFLVIPGQLPMESLKKIREDIRPSDEEGPWMVLKINSEDVFNSINEKIDVVDGLFISRLDMALTVDAAMVHVITKELIQVANDNAKVVVVASELLGSMRHNATPTRAEVSDVANSVRDGADAVVVSEEVTHGPYAERAVELIERIVLDAEEQSKGQLNWKKSSPRINNSMDAVAFGAYRSAERMNAKAMVCITKSGNTAMSLAAYGAPIPIVSVTFSDKTQRRLSLIRGVQAMYLEAPPSIDEVLPAINDELVRSSWLDIGDKIVFVSVTLSPIGQNASNLFTIQRLNEKIPRSKD